MRAFVIVYTPGEAWIPGVPVREQPLLEHVRYHKRLADQGKLMHGGPFLDNAGGMAVLAVETPEEAEALLASDPAITGKVMQGALHPWLMVDWATFQPPGG